MSKKVKNKSKKKVTKVAKLSRPTPSWSEAKLVTVRRHRVDGALIFGVSTITRPQVLPEYERVWDQVILDELYQREISKLLDENHVVLKVFE